MAIPPGRLRLALLNRRLARLQQEQNMVLLALIRAREQYRNQRNARRWWVRPWIERRLMFGQYSTLMQELERESAGDFVGFMRMEPGMFQELLLRVAPRITKGRLRGCRTPLEPGLKLAMTLRYMATGNSYRSLAYSFRVPHNTISGFVPEVAQAIVDEYLGETMQTPSTPDGWRQVADRFRVRWNYHHGCGAIDGKHVAIKAPKNTGTKHYNYKGYFSIVLLGVVDGNYKFLWADVGAEGSASDAGIFNNGPLRGDLEEKRLGFPDPEPLPGDDHDIPYFLVGDDAFPLRPWMMKPYGGRVLDHDERIFNYRTSRARRVVENAFGILAHRWRVLLTTIQLLPRRAQKVTCGCIVLHNLMRDRYPGLHAADLDQDDGHGNIIPGAWRQNAMHEVNQVVKRRETDPCLFEKLL